MTQYLDILIDKIYIKKPGNNRVMHKNTVWNFGISLNHTLSDNFNMRIRVNQKVQINIV